MSLRNLVIVLGDQLDRESAVFDDFDVGQDAVWMAEVEEETTHVWCHKLRIAVFLSAMRHFRDECRRQGTTVYYTELSLRRGDDRGHDHVAVLRRDIAKLTPRQLIVTQPGDYRVYRQLQDFADALDIELVVREDRYFYCGREAFDAWAAGRQDLKLEDFYRWIRKRDDVLIEPDGSPVGGQWNLDTDNREAFKSPPTEPPRERLTADSITKDVLTLVDARFADHPGRLDHFDLPVTPGQARQQLDDFIEHCLPDFGQYQDAMWRDTVFLFHSRLSVAINLKLLDPRTCIEAAIGAYHAGRAPLNSVEGFVRQIIGWREYVRGIYWHLMPDYIEHNALMCDDIDVPGCYWDGETDMECVRQAMQGLLRHGYAHHIQRLMVLGLFAQVLGVHPRRFHDWHMAMYVDAIDWVSLPNALGMSQFGDGGVVGSKPYCASGNYINRMSNYCKHCRYDYRHATGPDACPVTTLYWDFLDRHAERLKGNQRLKFQIMNLEKRRRKDMPAIRGQAKQLKARARQGKRL